MNAFSRYRKNPGFKAYRVCHEKGYDIPWRVDFLVDGEPVGFGRYQSAEQADTAGVDFMFSGWSDFENLG